MRPAWFQDMLAGLAFATGFGYVAATHGVSRWLTRPSPGRPHRNPGDHGLAWERTECFTPDGLRLVGWVAGPPKAQPRATIALFHGVRQNREKTLDRLAFLAEAGYRCVAFDHRAHGQSAGDQTSFGFYESRDVVTVLNLIKKRWPDEPRAALGISMGAAALVYSGQESQGFHAVILESLYHDIASAFHSRIGNTYPAWFRKLSDGVIRVTERRLGVRLPQLAPVDRIAELETRPILLLTGARDQHAPPEDAERLFQQCRGPREMWIVPEAEHSNVYESGGQAYRERVLDFLDRRLAA